MGEGQAILGQGTHQGVWRPFQVHGEGLLLWSLGQNLDGLLPTWGHGQRDFFGPAAPNPWPDYSGKRARAPKLTVEILEQHKFFTGKEATIILLLWERLYCIMGALTISIFS